MRIRCAKCENTDEIFCGACSIAEIKKAAQELGWYMNREEKMICEDCKMKQRETLPKSFTHAGQKYDM